MKSHKSVLSTADETRTLSESMENGQPSQLGLIVRKNGSLEEDIMFGKLYGRRCR